MDGTKAFDIVYPGSKERDKKLFLFKVNNHCHPIVNLGAFFNKGGGYCVNCFQPYDPRSKATHSCSKSCGVCLSDSCRYTNSPVDCEDCGRRCRGAACYERHKKSPGSFVRGPRKLNHDPVMPRGGVPSVVKPSVMQKRVERSTNVTFLTASNAVIMLKNLMCAI